MGNLTPFVSAGNDSKEVGKMNSKKALFFSNGTLLAVVGLVAAVSGIMLILEPNGTSLGLSVDLLKDSPFNDYLYPAIILLVVNGIASLAVAVLSFMKHRYTAIGTILMGIAMVGWVSAQVYWMGWESWLQPTFLAIGVIEVGLGFFTYEWIQEDHGIFHHRATHSH